MGQGLWERDLNSCWAIGPTSGSSPSVVQGSNCAGTTLTGDHPENTGGYLRRNALSLPALASPDEKIVLWFKQWTNCYDGNDYGRVRVDSGVGMVDVGPKQTQYTSGWCWSAVDLTAYADSTIDLGFYFYGVNTVGNGGDDSYQGWYVDQLYILKGVIPEPRVPLDFDEGQRDWYATHGNWFVANPTAGPGTSYRGELCLSYVPWGDHPENTSSYFISPIWTIPDLGTGAEVYLNYRAWLSTYDGYDYYRIEA